jgi:hypothetical protein
MNFTFLKVFIVCNKKLSETINKTKKQKTKHRHLDCLEVSFFFVGFLGLLVELSS